VFEPLSIYTTEDLCRELSKRFDALLFCGYNHDTPEEAFVSVYGEDRSLCSDLAVSLECFVRSLEVSTSE
jgi:hypothetical protein